MRYLFVIFLMLAFSTFACAQDDNGYDKNTIRAADLPKNPPRFEQYPAQASFSGHLARPDVHSQPMARLFRTRIREGAQAGPNFAGHYTIVFWGCGAGCVSLAVVDANNGKVFFPKNLSTIDNTNIAYDELESPEEELIRFKRNSRLLVVIGGINEISKLRGISYFLWEKNQMKRIRFVAKPYV